MLLEDTADGLRDFSSGPGRAIPYSRPVPSLRRCKSRHAVAVLFLPRRPQDFLLDLGLEVVSEPSPVCGAEQAPSRGRRQRQVSWCSCVLLSAPLLYSRTGFQHSGEETGSILPSLSVLLPEVHGVGDEAKQGEPQRRQRKHIGSTTRNTSSPQAGKSSSSPSLPQQLRSSRAGFPPRSRLAVGRRKHRWRPWRDDGRGREYRGGWRRRWRGGKPE